MLCVVLCVASCVLRVVCCELCVALLCVLCCMLLCCVVLCCVVLCCVRHVVCCVLCALCCFHIRVSVYGLSIGWCPHVANYDRHKWIGNATQAYQLLRSLLSVKSLNRRRTGKRRRMSVWKATRPSGQMFWYSVLHMYCPVVTAACKA